MIKAIINRMMRKKKSAVNLPLISFLAGPYDA